MFNRTLSFLLILIFIIHFCSIECFPDRHYVKGTPLNCLKVDHTGKCVKNYGRSLNDINYNSLKPHPKHSKQAVQRNKKSRWYENSPKTNSDGNWFSNMFNWG